MHPGNTPWRPTRAQILAARDKGLPDVIRPGIHVLFCGINPGLYTAAVGHHFARPGNRFWPALHKSGFTPRQLSPFEEEELLDLGFGMTNVVDRATVAAGELTRQELLEGAAVLIGKVVELRPCFLAVLGIGAYRVAFSRPKASLGLQTETIGPTRIWVLPSPSGLNAHHPPESIVRVFAEFRQAVLRECP